MSVQFINKNNAGGLKLVNVNNAGNAVFKIEEPVPTPTPTPQPFNALVGYATTAPNACSSPISSFFTTGNASTFCLSTVFTAVQWNSIATGNYYVVYGGFTLNVSHTFGQGFATVTGGGCQSC